MASNAAFTVNDGTDDHVFSPTGIKDGRIATYANQAESMISGRESVVLSQKTDSKTVREVVLTTRIPRVVEETINGVTRRKVDNFGSISSKLLVPVDWTDEEVEMLRVVHAGSLGIAPYTKAADEAEFVW